MYPSKFLFVLVPEFSLYGLVPALEALRLANQNSGETLFRWRLASGDGGAVRASCGISIEAESDLSDVSDHDAVVICAGNHPLHYAERKILRWLGYCGRHGKTTMSIDSGSFLLAEAGLLDGYRATVHWEVLQLFQERYPQVHASEALFVIDRSRITCAGGHAALDMMLHIIQARHGEELARVVANGFVHARREQPSALQVPISKVWDTGGDRRLDRLLALMEQNTSNPMRLQTLAEQSGLSDRQMERMTKRRFDLTPSQLYAQIRLDIARIHLFHGRLQIKEIADLSGFASASAFCRAFKESFGVSPLTYRRGHSFDDLRRFRGVDRLAYFNRLTHGARRTFRSER